MNGVTAGASFQCQGLKFEGVSLSGIRTAISMPELGISFDVAQGYPYTLRMKKFFITHGHLDHAAGIPYIVSQKAMRNEPHPVFYMPPSLIEPLHKIMKLWEGIEEHEYHADFRVAQPGHRVDLNQRYFIVPFKTVHRIESLGYGLFSHVKKLKAEHRGLSQPEIADLKQAGAEVDEWIETPLVAFTGDTQIEFLDQAPWIRKCKTLICETTFLDEKKSIEHARKWGHTHLEELIPELDRIESEKIVLIHTSSRYSEKEIAQILTKRIPERHRDRVVLFPGR